MNEVRIAKTQAKLREGGLPAAASAADNMFLQSINGTVCTACGEPIERLQGFYSVRIRSADLMPPLRLHPVCHDLWVRFTPAPRADQDSSATART
jgi:hypothetical protein